LFSLRRVFRHSIIRQNQLNLNILKIVSSRTKKDFEKYSLKHDKKKKKKRPYHTRKKGKKSNVMHAYFGNFQSLTATKPWT
jgi:cell fate regulator YaaT (PSP1 superfamily)